MSDTSNINQPKIGMNTDNLPHSLQEGEYSFALNASYEDSSGNFGALQNTESNYLNTKFPSNYKVVGLRYILELDRTIYMLVNPTSKVSIIGEIINKEFTEKEEYNYIENPPLESLVQEPYNLFKVIVQSLDLALNIKNPVKIEYRITRSGLNIYFIDDLNPLRFIYFDLKDNNLILQDRFKIITGYDPNNCNLPIYTKDLDINKIRYNPNFSRPCIEFIDDVFGGSLKAGVYQAMVSYSDSLGNSLTKYFPATAPIPIQNKSITINTDYKTDKALVFKINNLEQSNVYSHYNLVIAETVNSFTEFKLVATLPVSQETYTYTGNGIDYKTLSSQEVFFERPTYSKAFTIGKVDDQLFFGNLEEYKKLNLQRVANKVKLFWQTKAIDENLLSDPRYSSRFRGYMRDETYAMGIVFEMTDDNESVSFHVPGPSKEYFAKTYNINVDQLIDNEDVVRDESCVDSQNNKNWQIYNLAKVIASPKQYSTKCDDGGVWEWGDFAYTQSSRLYPNIPEVWGELCNQPIRHHKFPDSTVTHFHDGLNSNKSYDESNIVYPIGIRVDHSSIIAALAWAVDTKILNQDEVSRIKGYRIVRGNRVGNKSVIAKGLLYDVWSYNKNNKENYYPNFPYNDLTPNHFIGSDKTVYEGSNTSAPKPSNFNNTKRYTFHSPDTHFVNPSPSNILKIETLEYGVSRGYFNECEEEAKYQILSQTARSLCFIAGVASVIGEQFQLKSTIEQEIKTDTFVVPINITAFGTGTTIPLTLPDPLTFSESFFGISLTPFKQGIYNRLTGVNQSLPGPQPIKRITEDIKGSPLQLMNPLGGLTSGLPTILKAVVTGLVWGAGFFNQGLYLLTRIIEQADSFASTIKKIIPSLNYTIQYNSIGRYNGYLPLKDIGKKIRPIETWQYLSPNLQNIKEQNQSIVFNNWNRESSLYLKLPDNKSSFNRPVITDNSRTTMNQSNLKYDGLNVEIERKISSYYGSLKLNISDQYGSIYNIEYLETDGCIRELTNSIDKTLFGGDTFISRFGIKRKHPMFLQSRFKQLDNADVLYSKIANVGFPNYFIDFNQSFGERLQEALDTTGFLNKLRELIESLTGLDETRLDAKVNNLFYQKGYIHLYNYGIPYFLVESDINCYYRHGENNKDKDFYPNNNNLSTWLQEKNVSIKEDNTFIYNKDYSKQNKESAIKKITPSLKFDDTQLTKLTRRIINTERTGVLNENDNWLIIKANNYTNIKAEKGAIFGIDGIEENGLLIRATNSTFMTNIYKKLQTTSGELQVGNGSIYDGIKEFSTTDSGFMGSQNRSMIKTEFGHVWTDSKRGQVFLLGSKASGLEEISGSKMRNWFKQNLPFQIAKDFEIDSKDLDNNFNGIGLHLTFDKRYSRLFLTKLDYKVINPNVKYDKANKDFYIIINGLKSIVNLTDPIYFCNKSWTISYNFLLKSWVSFYSFIPNFYNELLDKFQSGINSESTLWDHNVSKKSYQVFFGNKYPFIIQVPSGFKANNDLLEHVEYVNDVVRYHTENDWFYNRSITFNKAMVFNERQHSGLLNLVVKDRENLSLIGSIPRVENNEHYINITNVENNWKFNEFYDTVKNQLNNIPIWVTDCSNVNKSLNVDAFNYSVNDYDKALIRGKNCTVRLINDQFTNYKFIFMFTVFNKNNSI